MDVASRRARYMQDVDAAHLAWVQRHSSGTPLNDHKDGSIHHVDYGADWTAEDEWAATFDRLTSSYLADVRSAGAQSAS